MDPPIDSIESLAARWLAAENRAAAMPQVNSLGAQAERLGEAYDRAVRGASQEDILLAWESARRRQATVEIGSAEWGEARRVSELLRVEYEVARGRTPAQIVPIPP